ncbi:MAG TPA: OsmC family protein [Candidatus Limnocylindrales bacterium]|nr:OsmC family protein [Candidatus Limnocylindrales bacterium]
MPAHHRSATLEFQGGMRFVATTGSKRTIVFGDHPGENELSPVETVTASLAACTAMDVISIAAKKRQTIDRYVVRVEAIQRDDYPQVLTRVDIVHEVEGSDVQEAAMRRAIELSALKYCPVSAMLSAGATEVHHRYKVRGTGPNAFEAEGEVVVTGPFRAPDVVP